MKPSSPGFAVRACFRWRLGAVSISPARLLACAASLCATAASAAPQSLADALHAQAVEQFRAARFSAAYGRFVGLADAGHAASARHALWMCLHGPELFGKDWDCTGEQLSDWAQLAGLPTPQLKAREYPRHIVGGSVPDKASRTKPIGTERNAPAGQRTEVTGRGR